MSVSFRILILISVEGHLYVARISRWPSVVPRSFCVTRYVDPHCWNDGWIKEMSNNKLEIFQKAHATKSNLSEN